MATTEHQEIEKAIYSLKRHISGEFISISELQDAEKIAIKHLRFMRRAIANDDLLKYAKNIILEMQNQKKLENNIYVSVKQPEGLNGCLKC